jgi:hypothetical protein
MQDANLKRHYLTMGLSPYYGGAIESRKCSIGIVITYPIPSSLEKHGPDGISAPSRPEIENRRTNHAPVNGRRGHITQKKTRECIFLVFHPSCSLLESSEFQT